MHFTIISILFFTEDEDLCTFEGGDTCGWTSVESNDVIGWHVHQSDDDFVLNREKGPRFDHTYGSSKHIGKSS